MHVPRACGSRECRSLRVKHTLINNAHVHIVEQRIYGLLVRSANSTLDTAGDATRIRLSPGERAGLARSKKEKEKKGKKKQRRERDS